MNCTNLSPDFQTNFYCASLVDTNDSKGCLCSDLMDYCKQYKEMKDASALLNQIKTGHTFPILVSLGLFANTLLFLTLTYPSLSGVTFQFLLISVLAQMCQQVAVVLNTTNALTKLASPAQQSIVSTVVESFVDFFKRTIITLSLFLTLERFLAVCCPLKYAKINIRLFVVLSFVCSGLLGCLHFTPNFMLALIKSTVVYAATRSLFRNVMIGIKITQGVSIAALGLAIAIGLRRHGRKVGVMMDGESARQKHREMVALCRFQLIDSSIIVFDICCSAMKDFSQMIAAQQVVQADKPISNQCYYTSSATLANVNIMTTATKIDIGASCLQYFGHGELFVIYLLFFKKFRVAFLSLWIACLTKCKNVLAKNQPTSSMY